VFVFVSALTFALISSAQRWERLGPEGGIVVSLGAGSLGPVYLGTADGHVFASEDGASSWHLRGRIGNHLDAVVTRLVVDAGDSNLVFAAVWYRETAESGGVFGSEDGGRSWKPSGLEGEAVRALEAAPSNHLELVAGTRTGVFRSIDHGVTWRRISPEGDPELRNVDSVAIDPRDANVIYAGTYHLPWRTKDGGKTWEPIISGIIDDSDIMSLRLDSTNPDRLYMSACSGIYRSENQGGEWTKLQGIPYAARRTQTIVQDSRNPKIFYAGTTEGAWVTRDAGETWSRTTPKDWVVNSVLVLPARFRHAGRVIMGTESGVHISDDDGQTFAASNAGFTHVVIKQLLAGYHDSNRLLMLVQRNGWELLESSDQGTAWDTVPLTPAKPGKSALVPDQIEEAYGSPWGWLLRMANGGFWLRSTKSGLWNEWKPLTKPEIARSKSPNADKSASQQAVALQMGASLAFANNDAIASSRQGLMLCSESGDCRRLLAFRSYSVASAIRVSATRNQIAVIQDGKLGMSSDEGESASWRDLPVPASQALWIDEASSATQPKLVLGTARGLFFSADGGSTWTLAKNGVPAGRMDAWLADPSFWLVSERTGGLYVSVDQGTSWNRVDQDAERGRFAGLVNLGNGNVLAGSQAEGLLRLAEARN
jgi:photosystem II stability/assembly factor-like uncharacterized protein